MHLYVSGWRARRCNIVCEGFKSRAHPPPRAPWSRFRDQFNDIIIVYYHVRPPVRVWYVGRRQFTGEYRTDRRGSAVRYTVCHCNTRGGVKQAYDNNAMSLITAKLLKQRTLQWLAVVVVLTDFTTVDRNMLCDGFRRSAVSLRRVQKSIRPVLLRFGSFYDD